MSRLKANSLIPRSLITALLGLSSISSCAQQNQERPLEAVAECTQIGSYSYALTSGELAQKFMLFNTENCATKSKLTQFEIEADTAPIAVWNDWILFDQGSDESSHEILIATFKGETFKSASFIGEVKVGSDIEFYTPTEEEATSTDCHNQQEAEEWERFGFVIFKAKAQRISKNLEITETNEFTCYALN